MCHRKLPVPSSINIESCSSLSAPYRDNSQPGESCGDDNFRLPFLSSLVSCEILDIPMGKKFLKLKKDHL